jgi:hypothetical protein
MWIYPFGDKALFITLENGIVLGSTEKRVTMKDAAAKIKVGITEQEVRSLIGAPSGGDSPNPDKHVTYLNDEAAIDSLEITYQGGRVSRIDVVPNAAMGNR